MIKPTTPMRSILVATSLAGLLGAAAAAQAKPAPARAPAAVESKRYGFGLVVRFVAKEGHRDDFIRVIAANFRNMPGCRSYTLAKDTTDDTSVWVWEVWKSKELHDAAVNSPRIKAATVEAKQFLDRRASRVVVVPVESQGL